MGTFTTNATLLDLILNTSSNNKGLRPSTLNTSIENNLQLILNNLNRRRENVQVHTLPNVLNTSSNNEGAITNTLNTSIKNNLLLVILVIPNVEALNRLHNAITIDTTDRNHRRLHNVTTPNTAITNLATSPAQQLEYRGFLLGATKGIANVRLAALATAALGTHNSPPYFYISWDPA